MVSFTLLRKFPAFKIERRSVYNNAFTRHFSWLRQTENLEHRGSDVYQLSVLAQLARIRKKIIQFLISISRCINQTD